MLYTMADNNIDIPAKRDGAIYNTFSGNQDYVIQGIGQEFEITVSSSSFLITLGTGEGLVGGRHITEITENNANSMIQVEANSTGYIVLRVDLTKPSGSEGYLYATPTIVQQNINNNGTIRDLPLYAYVSDDSGISSFIDMRSIKASANQSTVKTLTLLASNWNSDTYTISDSLITSNSNQEILPSLDITEEQLSALQSCNLQDNGQVEGSLTLKAFGGSPSIDIPIRVIFRGLS